MEKQTLKKIIAIFFIIVNEAIQRMVTSALQYNMIIYLLYNYQMEEEEAANIVSVYKAGTTSMSLLIAFFSDSSWGRFSTIGVGSFFATLGIFFLCSTTMPPESQIPVERPFLFFCLLLISFGVSCVRCSVAFAADQLENFREPRVLEKFFTFYYASSSIPDILAFTGTTYLVEAYGWKESLRFPLIPLVLCVFTFFVASPLYVKEKPKRNLFSSFLQVTIVAIRNRNLPLPPPGTTDCYHSDQNSEIEVPSESLRLLNKACLVRNRERDIAPDGSAENSWKLCSVEQVEEVKKLIKVIPFWSAGIALWINASQGMFMSLQAGSMERHLSATFEIPVAVFSALTVATMIIWMIIYGILILPLVSMFKGEPVQLGTKTRMGIGLFLSLLAMVISTIVERIRQGKIQEINTGMLMPAWSLLPQYGLIGISLAFAAVAQMEFLFTELPPNMWSIAADLLEKGTTLANFLSGTISDVILDLSSGKGQPKKLWNDTEAAPFGDFYLVLALITFISLFCYGYCYWWHGPCKQESENNDDQ